MTGVTEVRDSGIEILSTDVQDTTDAATAQHFRTEDEVEIPIGESAGNEMFVRSEYFVAISIDGAVEMNPMQAMTQGIEVDEDAVVENDEGEQVVEVDVNEASVFVSNEDGEVGGGVHQEDGGTLDGVLDNFEENYL